MLIKDIMSKSVISVEKTDSLETAAKLMQENSIGVLPVLDKEKLVGIITDRDIVTRAVSKGNISAKVGEIMSKSTVCLHPEQSTAQAFHLMSIQQIKRLPIVSDEKVCGMLSISDLSRVRNDMEFSKSICEIFKP